MLCYASDSGCSQTWSRIGGNIPVDLCEKWTDSQIGGEASECPLSSLLPCEIAVQSWNDCPVYFL